MAKTTQTPISYIPSPDYPGENIFQASRRRRAERKEFDEYQKQQEALRQQYLYDQVTPGAPAVPFVDEQAQFMGQESPRGLVAQEATPETRGMNPFLKSMRDSGVPEPVVQFLQNNPQATKEDIQAALSISADAATSKTGGRGEYYVPIQTAKGIYSFNSRTGELKDSGGNVIGSSSDPDLQARINASRNFGEKVGEEVADAGRIVDMGSSIKDATKMLDRGIYSGFYGKAQLAAAKATPGFDKQKAANTEEFISHIGNTVIPRLKEFGGNDTVEEMKYLQQVQAGNIELEPKAIKRILTVAERKIQAKQERLKRQAKTVGLGGKVDAALPVGEKPANDRKAREEAALRALRGR